MNNTSRSLLALAIGLASSSVLAMQALDDNSMQDITGQGGITIETTGLDQNGLISSTGEISFTQKDYRGTGDVTLTIDGTSNYTYSLVDDGNGGKMRTPTTIVRTYDIDSDGNLSIKTKNIDYMDTHTGAMSINGKRLTGGSEINVWKFADGSYLETFIENHADGAKIKSRTVMTQGSGYSQKEFANGITTATDVVYLPAAGETEFENEMILASDGQGGLRLEFGETRGTFEINGLRLFDTQTGENVFDAGKFETDLDKGLAYYDVGYGDIEVERGYMTIRSANGLNGEVRNGIAGEMSSDITIGKIYIRTEDQGRPQQYNINNAKFVVKGDILYDLELVDYGRVGGLEGQLISQNTTADLTLGRMTFSNAQNESHTMASMGVKDFSLEGGTADLGIYSSNFFGNEGIRQVLNVERASFKLTVAGEDISDPANDGQPIVQGDVMINNFVSDQHTGNTKFGMYTVVENSSFSMSINALRAGKESIRAGETGRLVLSNYQQMPGSYTLIEPLRN